MTPGDGLGSAPGDDSRLRYTAKRNVEGELLYIFCMRADNRYMSLETLVTRALRAGEVHELIVSSSPGLAPGADVPDVAYVGFFEVDRAGIAEVGDEVFVGDRLLGRLAGFDLTHMPNHMNIVVASAEAATGAELGLEVGTRVRLCTPAGGQAPPGGIHVKLSRQG